MKILLKSLLLASFLISPLASCSKKAATKNNAQTAYVKAKKLLDKKSYIEAADAFVKIDEEYPFSKWARKAQTMAVYAYYKEEDYENLLQIVDDFIRLNPASEYVPYMLYMKGLSYYNKIPHINRSQDDTQKSSYAFRELVARFPGSDYKQDSKARLVYIDEHLAGAKMSIGRYEMKNRNFIGAIDNFSHVIHRYHYTNQAPEAYLRLVEIYYKIGLKKEAKQAYDELKLSAPTSKWLALANKIDSDLF